MAIIEFLSRRRVGLTVGAIILVLCGAVGGILYHQRGLQESARILQPIDSPATARLGRDLAQTLELLDSLAPSDQSEAATRPRCERCSYLAQVAAGYRDRATAALADVRQLEAALSRLVGASPSIERTSLERQLAARQSAAGRAVEGLRSFSNGATACESERLCTRDDPARSAQTQPLNCARDGQAIRAAAARIGRLADHVIAQARDCQSIACPMMNCDRSAALSADLQIVEMSLAELAGGRTALPGVWQNIPTTGLATVLGGVERALARLALDSAESSLSPDVLAARAGDMRDGLRAWLAETEHRRGVRRDSWRVSALIGEIDVAAEWALGGETAEYRRAYFAALTRAMLSAARLDAALSIGDESAAKPAAAGPVCGTSELAEAYLKAGHAIAALGFCRAKSACTPSGTEAMLGGSLRSASDNEIGALAAVTGALPLGEERGADAGVTQSFPVTIAFDRTEVLAGEIVSVSADTSPSACLIDDGAIGLVRAGAPLGSEERYRLVGGATSEISLAAPTDPGRYVVRVFASPDRGGHLLSEHGFTVQPLQPGCDGFTGLWDTSFGHLRLVDRDGRVTGSYRRGDNAPRPGLVVGARKGSGTSQVFEGTWLSELGRGGTRLRLTDNGVSFRGTWGVTPSRTTGGGAWNGTCLGLLP